MPSSKFIFLGLMVLAVGFELIADYCLKRWSISSGTIMLGLGLLTYFVGTVFWAYSLKYESLSHATMVFVILSLIGAVLIGVFLFDEHLSFLNKLGILLGIVSILLVEW